MPELPEVETVKNGFLKLLNEDVCLNSLWHSPLNLRFPYDKGVKTKLVSKVLVNVERRAKYLLFDFGGYYLVSHLGMSGTWREGGRLKKHDHVELSFSNGKVFTFNDPRRFGFLKLVDKLRWQESKLFSHLGLEPLSKDFDANYLLEKIKNKNAPIKNLIMDQKIVVGVGNIYASEALFLSKIKPTRSGSSIKKTDAVALVLNIKKVLKQAIKAGGSYIRDFQNLEGAAGFQRKLYVYGRELDACKNCKSQIKKIVQAGRSSFYCGKCQR